eukprot:2182515-Karenia_brevis.AAC.1
MLSNTPPGCTWDMGSLLNQPIPSAQGTVPEGHRNLSGSSHFDLLAIALVKSIELQFSLRHPNFQLHFCPP